VKVPPPPGVSAFGLAKHFFDAYSFAHDCVDAAKRRNQQPHICNAFSDEARKWLRVINDHRVEAIEELATARGWLVAATSEFTFEQLANSKLPLSKPTYDERMAGARYSATHPEIGEIIARNEPFAWFTKDGLPAALLVPTFWTWGRCKEFARLKGLGIEQIEHPWHYPEKTVAVLYTRDMKAWDERPHK
jgi:hypothetical protein